MSRIPLRPAIAIFAATLALGLAAPAFAQKAKILSGTRSGERTWAEFVQKIVQGTNLYPDGVDIQIAGDFDPTFAELMPYRLVIVLANDYGISSTTGFGNVLGDYMAMVPNASVLLFYYNTWQTGLFAVPVIGGRFRDNYALTSQVSTSTSSATSLGTVTAGDPVGSALLPFTCGTSCIRLTGLMPKPGATVVARWADMNLLAIRGRNRVDLNMPPVDSTVLGGSWAPEGAKLITNAVIYLSSPVSATPAQVAFPGTPLGSASAAIKVTFRNGAKIPVTITGISIEGTDKGMFSYRSLQNPTPMKPLALGPGASFSVDVTYKPTAQGAHTASLSLPTIGFGRIDVPLQGASKGNLFIAGAPVDFGGIPTGTTKGPFMVSLTNAGPIDINMKKPALEDTMHYAITYAVMSDEVTLSPGATYRFFVEFKPGMMPGEFPTKVTVLSDDPSSPLEIPVVGMAGPPKLSLPYVSLLMPDTAFGSKSLPLDVIMTNSGNSDLDVISVVSSSMDFEIAYMKRAIKARQQDLFQVTFNPKMAGLRSGRITITSNEPGPMGMTPTTKTIDVAGFATVPKFKTDKNKIDFGTVNIRPDPYTATLTLINEGDGELKIQKVEILAGPTSDSFRVSSPPPTIKPFSSTDLTVTLAPRAAGMLSARLVVTTDLAMMGSAQVDLVAEVNGAIAQITPKVVEFGNQKVNSMAKKSISIKNNGNRPLTIRSATLTQPAMDAGVFSIARTVGVTVDGMKTHDLEVTFAPRSMKAYTARVDLDTDDPAVTGGTKFVVDITGAGVTTNVQITPLTLDFSPPIYVGQKSGVKSVTVRNIGDVDIASLKATISGQDAGSFAIASDMFKKSLKPNEQTEIGVYFEPQIAKQQNEAFLVIEADGVRAMMQVTLKGVSYSATVSAAPMRLVFPATAVGEQSMARAVSLTNEGTEKLEVEIVPPPDSQDFLIDTADTATTLVPGEPTKFKVTFAPQSAGTKSESIDILLKGTKSVVASVGIEGEAVMKKPEEGGCGCVVGRRYQGGYGAAVLLLLCGLLLASRRRRA